MANGEATTPLDCDPKVAKPVPKAFVLDCIQSQMKVKKIEFMPN